MKKKKKMKILKSSIFSLLLLFCFCVPFLVHKNNVNAEVNIADLSNTTWKFDEYLLSDYTTTFTYDISLSVSVHFDGQVFSTINDLTVFNLTENAGGSKYFLATPMSFENEGSTTVVNINGLYSGKTTAPRISTAFRTNFEAVYITFLDGTDIDNSNAIAWIQANAIQFIEAPEEPEPTYTIKGQYQFNDEVTWLYDTSEQEGILYLPFYVYNPASSTRVNYDYMLNSVREDLDNTNYFLYGNETNSGVFTGQYAGIFTTSTTINMFDGERIVYFYTAEIGEELYIWLNENGQFINDPSLDDNNPDNPDSNNNPNNPNNPNFGTDTVRQIVNQVNAFLGIQILPGLAFRDILLICIALPLLMYILKVFLGG